MKKNQERASGDRGCRLPEDEHRGSHAPNTERNIILGGFWRLAGTSHHSRLPNHPQKSGGARRLRNVKFDEPAHRNGSAAHRLPSPTFGSQGPLVWLFHSPEVPRVKSGAVSQREAFRQILRPIRFLPRSGSGCTHS